MTTGFHQTRTRVNLISCWASIIGLALLITGNSCKKFIEIDPPSTQIVGSAVYQNDQTAVAALTGIYSRMMDNYPGFGNGGITLYAGLSADELQNFSTVAFQSEFYANALTPANSKIGQLWNQPWQFIYSANAVLEGLEKTNAVSEATKKQLMGEAKFIRAFCHFYLVNLYGQVPYLTTTDYRITSKALRRPVADVYEQMIADLKEAQNLLSLDYSFANNERTRPNRFAAAALLARVYLYQKDWTNAEAASSSVIGNTNLYELLPDINTVFLKNSREAIWQLQPVSPNMNSPEGNLFILNGSPGSVAIYKPILTSYEAGDARKLSWIKGIKVGTDSFYYTFKYKIKSGSSLTEYYMVLRLAEMYLIRAEARVHKNDFAASQSDLNFVRTRAGLPNTTANDNPSLLSAIEQERRLELFAEWGHRWLDLKRTGKIDQALNSVKPAWQPRSALFPIPLSQLQNNPNFSQNPGY